MEGFCGLGKAALREEMDKSKFSPAPATTSTLDRRQVKTAAIIFLLFLLCSLLSVSVETESGFGMRE
jgi:hypothetical protein